MNNVDRTKDLTIVCNEDKTTKLIVPHQFDKDSSLPLGLFPITDGIHIGGTCVIMSRDQVDKLVDHLTNALIGDNCDA